MTELQPPQQQIFPPAVAAAVSVNSNPNTTASSQSISNSNGVVNTSVTSNQPNLTSIAEFTFTSEQQRFISELLPQGYSFQFASKPIRMKTSSFTKNLSSFVRGNQDTHHRNANGQSGTSQTPAGAVGPQGQYQQRVQQSNFANQANQQRRSIQQQQPRDQITPQQINNMIPNGQQQQPQQQQQQLQQPVYIQPIQQQQQQQLQQQYQPYYSQQQPQLQQYQQQPYMPMTQNAKLTLKPTQPKQNKQVKKPNVKRQKAPPPAKVPKVSASNPRLTKKQKAHQNLGKGAMFVQNDGMPMDQNRHCMAILTSLQRHKSAIPFLRPVDPIKLNCPDYFSVIRDPMDLSTVEHNLRINEYHSTTQFAADVRKIWNNSYLYNSRESPIYNMTVEMDKYFEKKFKEMEQIVFNDTANIPFYVNILAQAIKTNSKVPVPIQMHTPAPQQGGASRSRQNQNQNQNHNQNHSQPPPQKKAKTVTSKMDTPMTMQEKKQLGQSIMSLPPDCLHGVWDIVKSDANQQFDDQVLQFDIDQIPTRKARELEQYVKHQQSLISKRMNKKAAKNSDKASEHEHIANQQVLQAQDQGLERQTSSFGNPTYSTQNTTSELQQTGGKQPAKLLSHQPHHQQQNMQVQQQKGPEEHYGQQNQRSQPTSHKHNNQRIKHLEDSDSSFMSGVSESQNY